MLRTSGPTSESRAILASVAWVSALMGLKATLPRILTQISMRIFCVTGQRNPALISASEIALHRSERVPSGSPSEMRFPSVWRMTPGSEISVAKYAMEANHVFRRNRIGNRSAWIDAFEVQAGELARVRLKIPPRNAILRADNGGVLADQRLDLRRKLRQPVRLHAEEDHVHGPGFRQIANDSWMNFEIAIGAEHAQPALLHRT